MTQPPRPGERWPALENDLINFLEAGLYNNARQLGLETVHRKDDGQPTMTITLPDCTVRLGVRAVVTAVRPQPEPEA